MATSPERPQQLVAEEDPAPIEMEPAAEDSQPTGETSTENAKPKKAKSSASEPLKREPGKSLFPYSRIQKILKEDTELIMVQREAVFAISRATEEFVARLAEACQRAAARDGRATVQHKDLVTCVRRADEFAFLEDLLPWIEPESASTTKQGKGKSGRTKDETSKDKKAPTTLDQFVRSGKDDSQEPPGEVLVNEDGTLSGGGPSEETS
ncbi:histone-fold-containing protein [Dichomitus squalens]|uniref:histone-fold-containing protein n=1 Tax=Dichomitus squalens (strain LYAD-421) TaxID=732165 RepID=UPI0004411736|nr:histone-fold-containing protein [Dichomitus squalens LYAD-421 SS1]EJF63346.1 histone-fold-containing protein [Dichomitus squalens LYAD-421 SS1]TBU48528.1 histone-fold-containing protein [Dichomitus squalens]